MSSATEVDGIASMHAASLQSRQRPHSIFDKIPALVFGPVAFLSAGRSPAFGVLVAIECISIALMGGGSMKFLLGLALLIVARFAALSANAHWTGAAPRDLTALAILVAFYGLIAARSLSADTDSLWFRFPTDLGIAPAAARIIDSGLDWLAQTFAPAFTGITAVARLLLQGLTDVLAWIPWPAFLVAAMAAGWWAGGIRTLAIAGGGVLYIALFGYWDKAVTTMALVGSAVALSAGLGVPIGVILGKSARITRLVTPALDAMQTLPSFVYLIPAVAFFSVGKPPAVLATVIVALPLMVRLTAFGIGQVPADVKEAAALDGAGLWSMLLHIELPLATPSILLGFNQTVMASLSMVVVAALIGAGGLGFDVLQALNNVQSGSGVLAGLAIVICAVVPDRLLQAAVARHNIGRSS